MRRAGDRNRTGPERCANDGAGLLAVAARAAAIMGLALLTGIFAALGRRLVVAHAWPAGNGRVASAWKRSSGNTRRCCGPPSIRRRWNPGGGSDGHVMHANVRFAEMWRIPEEAVDTGDDDALRRKVMDQLEDPEAFSTRVQALYRTADTGFDTLVFKDGRCVGTGVLAPCSDGGARSGPGVDVRDVTVGSKRRRHFMTATSGSTRS